MSLNTPAMMQNIFLHVQEGKTQTDIAATLGIARSTLSEFMKSPAWSRYVLNQKSIALAPADIKLAKPEDAHELVGVEKHELTKADRVNIATEHNNTFSVYVRNLWIS